MIVGRSGKEVSFANLTRQSALQQIQSMASHGSGILQVTGDGGAGKTRLVYEALKVEGIRERTVYAANLDALEAASDLWRELHLDEQSAGTILVVDNLDRSGTQRLLRELGEIHGRNLVIPITTPLPGESAWSISPHVSVGILSDQEIATILQEISGQPEHISSQVAKHLGGSPALAMTVGDVLSQGVEDWASLVSAEEIGSHVTNYFTGNLRHSLRVVALVSSTTTSNDGFARLMCQQIGLGWADFTESIQYAVSLGVVEQLGDRFLFGPALLANWFAADAWTQWRPQIEEVYLQSEDHKDDILEALSSLGHIEPARQFASKVSLSPDFLAPRFFTDSAKLGRRLSILGMGFPEEAIAAAQRLVLEASDDTLRAFVAGRQDLVSLLTELV